MTNERRVVITGIGFILPLGTRPEELSEALHRGHPPFVRSDSDSEVAVCPVQNFDLKAYTGRFKYSRYLSRGQQLCLAATMRAVENAGLAASDLENAGLYLGLGPNLKARPRTDKALWLLDYLPNTLAASISQILGLRGENSTILTACSASTQALGQAFAAVRHGLIDRALAGGGDSRTGPEAIQAYKQAGVLGRIVNRPDECCRPFDTQRSGFAIGEGGAMFVVESLEHATKRNATILAEIMSAASSLDGYGMTNPEPEGRAASLAMASCLNKLGHHGPVVVAHGTGTLLNDEVESRLIARVSPSASGVIAFKSWIGHLASACGAAELALAIVCARDGIFPEIRNLDQPCRDDLPFFRSPTPLRPESLLIQSFGFGGQNACLGVRPWN